MSDVTVSLANPTAVLLEEIAMPEMTRGGIAKTYRLAMMSSEPTDWPAVNRAIVARWSNSVLEWIKRRAHAGKP